MHLPVAAIKTVQYSDKEGIFISDAATRHCAQQEVSDIIQTIIRTHKHTNTDKVMIIRRNGVDRCSDIIYAYDKTTSDSRTSPLEGLNSIDCGVITISFHTTDSSIRMTYSYGCSDRQYEGEIEEGTLVTDLSMFFHPNSNCKYTSLLFGNIQKVISIINAKIDKQINIHHVINCFVMHDINQNYFHSQSNGRKLEFIQLLKTKCKIKARHATILWDNLCTTGKNNKSITVMNSFYDEMIHTQYELSTQLKKKNDEISQLKKMISLYIRPHMNIEQEVYEANDLLQDESQYESEILWSPSVCMTSISSCVISDTDIDEYGSSDNIDINYEASLYCINPKTESNMLNCAHFDRFVTVYNAYNNTIDTGVYANIVSVADDYMHLIIEHCSNVSTKQSHKRLVDMDKIINGNYNIIRQMLHIMHFILDLSTGNARTCTNSTTSKQNKYSGNNQHSQKQNNNNNSRNVSCNNEHCGGDDGNGNGNGNYGDGGGREDRNNDDEKKTQKNADEDEEEEEDEKDEKDDDEKDKGEEVGTKTLNPNAKEYNLLSTIYETDDSEDEKNVKREHQTSTGAGRVKISKTLTNKIIPQRIREHIPNIFNYMNKSLIFKEIQKYDEENHICVINFNFHDKISKQPLYCVITRCERGENGKYKLKMEDELFTNIEIKKKFNISHNTLPQPITTSKRFSTQILSITCLKSETIQKLVLDTKWHNIKCHSKKNNKERKILSLSATEFRNKIKKYNNMENVVCLVPIVRTNRKQHYWIEHLWIVRLDGDVTIAISLQYNIVKHRIEIKGIHLNKDFIVNAHQLIPCKDCRCLDNFVSFYDELLIGDVDQQKNTNKQLKNRNKLLTKELHRCRKHIKTLTVHGKKMMNVNQKQLDSDNTKSKSSFIQPLVNNQQLTSTPKSNSIYAVNDFIRNNTIVPTIVSTSPHQIYHINQNISHQTHCNVLSIQHRPAPYPTSSSIQYTPQNPYPYISQDTYAQIIPSQSFSTAVRSNPFFHNMNPNNIGIPICVTPELSPPTLIQPFITNNHKKLIFIPKSLTKWCLMGTEKNFNDSKNAFYYLMQTISMQINDRFAKIYDNKLVIVNCDLSLQPSGNKLYGIIEPNNGEFDRDFEWKMMKLSDSATIYNDYHIRISYLPMSSRNKPLFQRQLFQHKNINVTPSVIDKTNFNSIKAIKNKSRQDGVSTKKDITISAFDIKESVKRALQNHEAVIPIVKIKNNIHWIESVVICELRQYNVNFGVSFRNNHNRIEATSIFLDKTEIENQNKLTGDQVRSGTLDRFISGMSKMIVF